MKHDPPVLAGRRARELGRVLRAAFLLGILVAAASAAGAAGRPAAEAVVPPGQDDLLADMLARSEALPGECRFTGGGADGPAIRAAYACAGGTVELELRHPSAAADAAVRTGRFAIVLRDGSPPAGFVDALARRVRAREDAFRWEWLSKSTAPGATLSVTAVVLPAAALVVCSALAVLLQRRRRRPLTVREGSTTASFAVAATRIADLARLGAARLVSGPGKEVSVQRLLSRALRAWRWYGVLAIAVCLPTQFPPSAIGEWPLRLATLTLMGFLWLVISGQFGCASFGRSDWPAFLPFLLALAVREGYARHGNEELELFAFRGAAYTHHSILYPLFAMFVQRAGRDPYLTLMHVNGVLSALAALPLYLFIRQRTRSRTAGLLVATFFAVHPIIVQIAPTDGPYSLIFLAWFSALALLTSPDPGPSQLCAAALLLGIVAACRGEAVLYVLVSVFLVDPRTLFAAVRRHPTAAALGAAALLGIVAIHIYAMLRIRGGVGDMPPVVDRATFELLLQQVLRAGLWSYDFNDPLFVPLTLLGAIVGILHPRLRVGLGAALGALVVVWPMSTTTVGGYPILHRLVPTCALQVIAAGVGVYGVGSWLPERIREHVAFALPGVGLALFLLFAHRREIHDQNGLTDEFWMLRDHLAPRGLVNHDCAVLSFTQPVDSDIHDLAQVLPGVRVVQCGETDCVQAVAEGGCFYYVRSLGCYPIPPDTSPACSERGKTAAGDPLPCLLPTCATLERSLVLVPVDERTVDMRSCWTYLGRPSRSPRVVDIGLYSVLGTKAGLGAGLPPLSPPLSAG